MAGAMHGRLAAGPQLQAICWRSFRCLLRGASGLPALATSTALILLPAMHLISQLYVHHTLPLPHLACAPM